MLAERGWKLLGLTSTRTCVNTSKQKQNHRTKIIGGRRVTIVLVNNTKTQLKLNQNPNKTLELKPKTHMSKSKAIEIQSLSISLPSFASNLSKPNTLLL